MSLLSTPSFSEQDIASVLGPFYAKVRRDPLLGPVFATAIPDEAWPAHIATIQDFWSSVMLKSGRYRGNPFAAHLGKGIEPKMFDRWLALFEETCRNVLSPDQARALHAKAVMIGDSLKAGLFFRPEARSPL